MILAERCHEECVIRDIMLLPDIWNTSSEDGISPESYSVDTLSDCWVTISDTAIGEVIGLWQFEPWNSCTLQVHVAVPPVHRKGRIDSISRSALDWFVREAPSRYQKLVAVIPVIYPNVISHSIHMGFRREGLIRESFRKKGKIVDSVLVGVTRNELSGK